MNGTVLDNQTSSFFVICADPSEPGFLVGVGVIALDFIVLLPIQIWVLWLGTSNCIIRGRLTLSEIFTMNLSAIELFVIIIYSVTMLSLVFNYQEILPLFTLFSGSYLVGRPIMNSLICFERYMAVALPVMYRSPAFVKHRYIAALLVWMLMVAYGGLTLYIYPQSTVELYILTLSVSVGVIAACSLGVLKVLWRPSPGETQRERMDSQKKRAFVTITVILVCISIPYGIDVLLLIRKNYLPKYTFCLIMDINFWLMRPSSAIQSVLYLSKQRNCTRKSNS